jgi:hypothetical protein
MDEIDQRQRFVCCALSKEGYDKSARSIPPELRDAIFQRAVHKCERCGRPEGETYESVLTIQHMRGSSNDPADLREYCGQCNTIDSLRLVTARQLAGYGAEQLVRLGYDEVDDPDAFREPRIKVLMREIELRVRSRAPLLPCDDASAWQGRYKELLAERRDHFRAELGDDDDDFDEDPSLYVWPYLHSGEPR